MFNNPFSFSGRIRRLEYGLSYLFFTICFYSSLYALGQRAEFGIVAVLFIITLYWFVLAQGAKRCQDLNNNGFYQLIPFYGLWMLFEEGTPGSNKYGGNPKVVSPKTSFSFTISKHLTQNDRRELVYEILGVVLFNLHLLVLSIHFISHLPMMGFLCGISIVASYLVMLILSNHRKLYDYDFYLFKHRLLFSILLYLLLRTYQFIFQNFEVDVEEIYTGVGLVLIIWGLTYLSQEVYLFYYKNKLHE